MSSWWRRSAVDVDTLSWLTSSIVTIWVSATVAAFGVGAMLFGTQAGHRPAQHILAIVMMTAAAWLIHDGAHPRRSRFGHWRGALVYALAALAVVVSASSLIDRPPLIPVIDAALESALPLAIAVPFSFEVWWAPVGAALVVMASSPFVAGRTFVPGAIVVTIATAFAAALLSYDRNGAVVVADVIVAVSSPLFAIIGGALLTRTLVIAVEQWRGGRLPTAPAADAVEPVLDVVDRITAGRFSRSVVPFLERMLTAPSVTSRDRRIAGRLADEVRTALVRHGDQSWLAEHLSGRPVYLADPYRLADTITVDQRGAIVALIDGLFDDPEAGVFAARLDLEPAADDAVAVALTVGLQLPEGRRTAVLAPYYLTVKSVVRSIEWHSGETLLVTFAVDSEFS